MPRATDLAGLLGSATLVASALVRLPVLRTLPRPSRVAVLVLATALGLWPFFPLSLLAYVRGVCGDLSITTLALLMRDLAGRLRERGPLGEDEPRDVMALVLVAGLALYPLALSPGERDPYALGFSDPFFLVGLFAVAVSAAAFGRSFLALVLGLGVLAWGVGVLESRNLWDYLVDPLVFAYAVFALLVRRAPRLGQWTSVPPPRRG